MAGLAWPMKCGSCSANVKEEGDAFAVWKCRQDHYFATCGAECQRMFDKKSRKVIDAVEKLERRLHNEGQMNALRRLPPVEREKLKQKAEADSTEGMLICPADAKVGDRAVPHCAHCMVRCGGQAQEDSKAAPPPPPRPAAGQSPAAGAGAVGLVDDDQLVVLKKESDVIEEEEAAPTKKKSKAKKGKEKKVLLIGFEPYKQIDPDGDSEAAVARPGATKSSPGASVWTAGRPTAVEIGQQSKISQLCDTTGCSEQRARELLVTHSWMLQQAADAFFEGQGTTPSAAPRTAVRTAASVVAQAKPEVQPQPAAAAAEPTVASMPPPPLPQPPPPYLPPDWLAVWNEEGAAYYYWHKPTNHVQWDLPASAVEQGPSATERAAEAHRLAAEEAQRAAAAAARAAAEERARAAAAEEEQRRRRAEAERQRAEDLRRAEEAERIRKENLVVEAALITGAEQERCKACLEGTGWDLEPAVRMLAAEQDAERRRQQQEQAARQEALALAQAGARRQQQAAQRGAMDDSKGPPWERVCTRHWRPLPNLQNTMRLLQGERVQVFWTDEDANGWAWGHTLEDPTKYAYFPLAVLEPMRREAKPRMSGEVCFTTGRFDAPQEIGGYLSVAAGDRVELLHPIERPYVWAYAKRITNGESSHDGSPDRGWLPEVVLCDLDAQHRG